MSFRSGALVTLAGQWGRYVLTLLGIVVISRLLSPAEVGLVAMAMVVTMLATMLADFGLGLAAIQAERLSEQQRSNLFWANTGIGVAAAVVVCALAGPVAAFYEDPRVVDVLVALSATLVLNGLGVQARVDLTRDLRFTRLAWIDLVGASAGLGAAVLTALAGAGYWSLVWQQVVLAAVTTVLLGQGSARVPMLPRPAAGMRGFFAFGANNLAVQVTNFAASNVNTAALGRHATDTVVGLYNRAFQLTALPVQQMLTPLTRVMLPRLSRLEDPDELQAMLVRLQRVIVVVSLGAVSALAAAAPALLEVVLGADWTAAAPFVRVLCLATALQVLAYVYYWAFLARARTGLLFFSELPGRLVVLVLSFPVAAYAGPVWVCLLIAVQQAVIWACGTFVTTRRIGVRAGEIVFAGVAPLVVYALAAASAYVVGERWLEASPLLTLGAQAAVWCGVVVGALAVPRFRADVRSVVGTVRGR